MKITINNRAANKDIFHSGDIVEHVDSEIIILVTGVGADTFTGIVLDHFNSNKVNCHEDDWGKDQFQRFHGSITLEN